MSITRTHTYTVIAVYMYITSISWQDHSGNINKNNMICLYKVSNRLSSYSNGNLVTVYALKGLQVGSGGCSAVPGRRTGLPAHGESQTAQDYSAACHELF